MKLENYNLLNGWYSSVQIQTLSGIVNTPKNEWTKLATGMQSFIAYILTAGLIIGSAMHPVHWKQLGFDILLA